MPILCQRANSLPTKCQSPPTPSLRDEAVALHIDHGKAGEILKKSKFWLQFASRLAWDPRREINAFEDLRKFPLFEDEWLRGGPVRRWLPKELKVKPILLRNRRHGDVALVHNAVMS